MAIVAIVDSNVLQAGCSEGSLFFQPLISSSVEHPTAIIPAHLSITINRSWLPYCMCLALTSSLQPYEPIQKWHQVLYSRLSAKAFRLVNDAMTPGICLKRREGPGGSSCYQYTVSTFSFVESRIEIRSTPLTSTAVPLYRFLR